MVIAPRICVISLAHFQDSPGMTGILPCFEHLVWPNGWKLCLFECIYNHIHKYIQREHESDRSTGVSTFFKSAFCFITLPQKIVANRTWDPTGHNGGPGQSTSYPGRGGNNGVVQGGRGSIKIEQSVCWVFTCFLQESILFAEVRKKVWYGILSYSGYSPWLPWLLVFLWSFLDYFSYQNGPKNGHIPPFISIKIEYGSNPEHIVGQPSPNISHAIFHDW